MSLTYAIDVSNWQPADLGPIIAQHQPTHVVVRASTESIQHRTIARRQVQTALAAGCTVSAYIWVYFDISPTEHTANALSVMDGLPVDLFWLDCEGESAGGKLDHWLSQSVGLIEQRGKRAGIYTGAPWWRENGDSKAFSRLPLWLADWTGQANLDPPSLGWFGGWTTLAGRQWSDTGGTLDRDVFDPAVLAPADPCTALKAAVRRELATVDECLEAIGAARARLAELVG